ncbi:MAG: hypothetical protein U5K70_02345 [Halodesulfurarchaeum sp.]|nr:hypothetical protein [Halodesulfurarchaeum sp.]
MEKRKLQEVGGGTITVSLPHSWAEKHDVSAGTEVFVRSHLDGSLELWVTEPTVGAFGTLTLEGKDAGTATDVVRAAFEAGYERVVLNDPDSRGEIERGELDTVIRELAGVEITEEPDGKIVIEEVLDATKVSIPQSLRHIHYGLSRLQKRTHEMFENRSRGIEPMIDRNGEIRRGVRRIERHFTRALRDPAEMDALGEPRYRLYHYTRIAQLFERAAQQLLELARIQAHSDGQGTETRALTELFMQASRTLENGSKAALRENSVDEARSALSRRSELHELASGRRSALIDAGNTDLRTFSTLDHIAAIGNCGGRIAEISLQMAIGTTNETDGSPERKPNLDLHDLETGVHSKELASESAGEDE